MISRRLQAAGQKVAGSSAADAQSLQAAACAHLAAALGTKTAFAPVASLLRQSSPQAAGGSLRVQQTLLELCLSGEHQCAINQAGKNMPHQTTVDGSAEDTVRLEVSSGASQLACNSDHVALGKQKLKYWPSTPCYVSDSVMSMLSRKHQHAMLHL